MKRIVIALALAAFLSTWALAQDTDQKQDERHEQAAQNSEHHKHAKDRDINNQELTNLDSFLDQHQNIRKDLMSDPNNINSQTYLASHPELQEFLQQHPGVRDAITAHPKEFMQREKQYEGREGENASSGRRDNDINQQELKNFDGFLDQHQDIRKDLMSNPNSIKDQNYLNRHPELNQFLQSHPGVRDEITENPQGFIDREKQFERSEPR